MVRVGYGCPGTIGMPCVPAKEVCPRGWESWVKKMVAPMLSKSEIMPLM